MQPRKNQEHHTMEEDVNADTRNASSSSISVTKQTKDGSMPPRKEVVHVNGENRQVTAWVSGLMCAATFKRYAKRMIKQRETREVVVTDDQTDGTKHVQGLDATMRSTKNHEGQIDYCNGQKQSMD